ncbi:hypothetical protein C2E25_00085 [Geothermobacter hydrogeniphilus]|uniref:TPR repeat n=1 Tax=Geothermobacter hydrogeniphilus TaxID=1969733 RepID=A0A2K2HEF1_9BACT|nr:tetratricopeptide repeat protein [Geothermobacter hydrogeniphilus]PNU21666.1 hypothetical protein C2E25_00085 [Geothermobacter hydrogeniphilus]
MLTSANTGATIFLLLLMTAGTVTKSSATALLSEKSDQTLSVFNIPSRDADKRKSEPGDLSISGSNGERRTGATPGSLMNSSKDQPGIERQRLMRSAMRGDPTAQYLMGLQYLKNSGFRHNHPGKARYWLKRAALNGLPAAETEYGLMLFRGEGGATDRNAAITWLRKGAAQNDSRAAYALGLVFSQPSYGLPRQPVRAARYFTLAARNGLAEAQYYLAKAYLDGSGRPYSPAAAFAWLRLAARQGDPDALSLLGRTKNQIEKDRDEEALRAVKCSFDEPALVADCLAPGTRRTLLNQ